MMNLMVDGVKKDGLQLPPEPAEDRKRKVKDVQQEELSQSKPAGKRRATKKTLTEATANTF
jgi:transposase